MLWLEDETLPGISVLELHEQLTRHPARAENHRFLSIEPPPIALEDWANWFLNEPVKESEDFLDYLANLNWKERDEINRRLRTR